MQKKPPVSVASPGRFLTFGAYARKYVELLQEGWAIPPERILARTGLDATALESPDLSDDDDHHLRRVLRGPSFNDNATGRIKAEPPGP